MSPADSDVDLRTLLDSIQEFIVAKDGQGRWLFVNRIVLEAYAMVGFDYVGITDVELIERFPTHAEAFRYNIDTDEQAWQNGAPTQIEKSFLGPDGRINTWEVVKTPHFDAQGGRRLLTIVSRNVTERKLAETALQESERRFRSLAYLDALTGIANRRSILDQIAHYRAGAAGHLPCALFYLDLDRFKAINDEFGHEFGDLLLVAFVARVSACLRAGDLLGRIGGDEFIVFLRETSADAALALAERLCSALQRPWQLQGISLQTTSSIGIAHCTDGSLNVHELIRRADGALYQAKRAGRARVVLAEA
ncbi:GGDEF domain-containing protein [Pseudomonas oryzihabitans]|uniref:PAS domain S-box-containing protein/diguanylate cyclase (GGDEF) domain-containing protein n=2 Tax=Pseudomonas TaxID=286 RepID=A0A1G5M757_9PSED|nr:MULTISPECIES: GGDEF domain-containing protein [Pseudomonas]NMY88767.1 GGDEF domain-containing protein [Pseudomonas psychrotolerans]SCZ20209.1 PAS domain S-box-containing protein/diguanylate cyclase (GGDEF) domain-containing protein [Pseudomonas psychrotolerans]